MVITISQVQRIQIECPISEYPDAMRKVSAENYRIIMSGPKLEDGKVDMKFMHIVAEKVVSNVKVR